MKEGLANSNSKTKGMLFDFKKEQKVTMNMKDMNYPLDMIFINMSKEVVAVRSLKPGNFGNFSRRRSICIEVNKDEGAGLVGNELISCTSDLLSMVGMAEGNWKRLLWTQETEEEEEGQGGVSQNDTYR
jgi:hypothetical protein